MSTTPPGSNGRTHRFPHEDEGFAPLRDFLEDQVAPALVADAVEDIFQKLGADAREMVISWCRAQQTSARRPARISDYFHHVLKRLHIFRELGLLTATFDRPLLTLAGEMIARSPESERQHLKERIQLLGKTPARIRPVQVASEAPTPEPPQVVAAPGQTALQQPLQVVVQGPVAPVQGSAVPVAAAVAPEIPAAEQVANLRFAALIDQAVTASAQGAPPAQLSADLLSVATERANSASDLEANLAQLHDAGVPEQTREAMLRTLVDRIPDWYLRDAEDDTALSSPAAAVERMVSLSESSDQRLVQLREVMSQGVQQANAGRLGRAVTVLGLASRLLTLGSHPMVEVKKLRAAAERDLDINQLVQHARDEQSHGPLREIFEFFPSFAIHPLLERLLEEKDRQERKKLIGLLMAHGEVGREKVSERLSRQLSGESAPWYVTRNLLHLLRQYPAPLGNDAPEHELAVALQFSEPDQPAQVVREAVGLLGVLPGERASRILQNRLESLGTLVADRDRPAEVREEIRRVIALILRQLLRADAGARAIAVEHILRETHDRELVRVLEELEGRNLARETAVVERLVGALRGETTGGLFRRGWTLLRRGRSSGGTVSALISALSSTPTPLVAEVLRELTVADVDSSVQRAAQKALDVFRGQALVEEQEEPSLEGQLDVFGLPVLLQSLEERVSSGLLVLLDADGGKVGTLRLHRGLLVTCEFRRLVGTSAINAMLQLPCAVAFRFTASQEPNSAVEPRSLRPLLFEAMRRYDEYQRLRTIVADDDRVARLPDAQFEVPPGDPDPTAAEQVWSLLAESRTARECENEVELEPYRVRHYLTQWLASGALERAS